MESCQPWTDNVNTLLCKSPIPTSEMQASFSFCSQVFKMSARFCKGGISFATVVAKVAI
jgi:hypothetical protein